MIDLEKIRKQHPYETQYEFIISQLVISAGTKRVFEIGTGLYTFSQIILSALEQTGGTLYTCDPAPLGEFQHPQMVKYIKTSDEMAETWNMPIDILMIDGDHNYPQVKRDFENFWPYLRQGGYCIFHDIAVEHPEYVKKLWLELKPTHKVQVEELQYPGLGVLQK